MLSMLCRGGSRPAATSKMERFVIIVNGWKPLTIITKRSILHVVAALDPPLLCKDAKKEATLSTISDSTDDSRQAIDMTRQLRAANDMHSIWQRLQKTFVDARVFYPIRTNNSNEDNGKQENTKIH